MSFLHERLGGFGKHVGEDAILDFVDYRLEQSNVEHAERIALLVREEVGIYRFGPMWAEYRIALPNHHSPVWLQSSDRALVINLCSTEDTIPIDIHASWDRINHFINAYEEWDPHQQQPMVSYQISQLEHCIPETLTRWHVARHFSAVLGQIEQAM